MSDEPVFGSSVAESILATMAAILVTRGEDPLARVLADASATIGPVDGDAGEDYPVGLRLALPVTLFAKITEQQRFDFQTSLRATFAEVLGSFDGYAAFEVRIVPRVLRGDDWRDAVRQGTSPMPRAELEYWELWTDRTGDREILGVGGQASSEQLRSARAARLQDCHPDKNPDLSDAANRAAARVNCAYERLRETQSNIPSTSDWSDAPF